MDAAGRRELIEELCSFEGRWPGTDAERRAANRLAQRLRATGRRVVIEPTYVHPEYSLVIAAHVLLALAGSLLAVVLAPVGFVIVLVAAASLYLDQSTRLYLIRRLFFRRASQNVVSPGPNPSAPARLILSAHYDAAKTGFVFGPRWAGIQRRLRGRRAVLLAPMRVGFWAGVAPLLAITGARLAGVDDRWLSIVQLLPTALLLVALVLLVDIALSGISPGAYDNASGVAAALSVAARLDADPPPHLDVWVVLPGAEECLAEGMRCYMKAHREDLDGERTFVVNLDSVAFGHPRYQRSEGMIVSYEMDQRLVELCDAIAAADRDADGELGATPVRHAQITDAQPAALAGMRTISILGAEEDFVLAPQYHAHADTPDKLDEGALERSVDFAVELCRQIDRDVGRRASR